LGWVSGGGRGGKGREKNRKEQKKGDGIGIAGRGILR